ncbi:MAG: hypothetical protein HWN79_10645 [Candidatus Lokiarchaeota archaeon]|nr:hypothetical protein [Candidatus Lokiarchaeota archaeon]
MKKINQYILIVVMLSVMGFPLIPMIPTVVAQTAPIEFSTGTGGQAKDWDPISNGGSSPVQDYSFNAMETLGVANVNFSGQVADWIPHLASSWEIEYWPEENNSLDILQTGGIKSIEFTLRNDVTFHDGSPFNATVAKWNFDRKFIADGNLTGNGLSKWKHVLYVEALEFEDYFTPSWNLTKFNNTMPQYGSWGGPSMQDEAMRGYVPIINNCTIVEDLEYGGKINITSNSWNSGLLGVVCGMSGWGVMMLSMDAYKDYFEVPIIGYGNDPSFLQTPSEAQVIAGTYPTTGFPGHMIGTGPYKFVVHDEGGSPAGGKMVKYEDWWNAPFMPIDTFVVDTWNLVWFPYGVGGGEALRNTALVTGEVDFGFHYATESLNYDDIVASAFVSAHDTTFDQNINIISLNCIDDWAIPDAELFPLPGSWMDYGDKSVRKGVPRAFRKALSYAFDYDTYISATKKNRAVRVRYPVGTSSPWYDDSIPYSYYDLDIARQALRDGGIAPPESSTWTEAEWVARAASNPLYVFDYAWDVPHEDVNNEVYNAMEKIGCATNQSAEWEYSPRVFTAIYNSMWLGGSSYPFYTAGAFNMLWPWADTLPPVGAMLGDGEPWNLGFSYNSTADEWLDGLNFASPAEYQVLLSKYADWFTNYQYGYIMISQDKNFYAISRDFQLNYVFDEMFQLPARIMYDPYIEPPAPLIPGFSMFTLTLVTLGLIAFITYNIKHKKNV